MVKSHGFVADFECTSLSTFYLIKVHLLAYSERRKTTSGSDKKGGKTTFLKRYDMKNLAYLF